MLKALLCTNVPCLLKDPHSNQCIPQLLLQLTESAVVQPCLAICEQDRSAPALPCSALNECYLRVIKAGLT